MISFSGGQSFGIAGIILVTLLLSGGANAASIYVPEDHAKIQWAIDNATAGDTIEVHSGTYYENVIVNKQLILHGVNTNGATPVVDGGGGTGISITGEFGDGITLDGFIVTNAGTGVAFSAIKNSNITNNTFIGNVHGIYGIGMGNT